MLYLVEEASVGDAEILGCFLPVPAMFTKRFLDGSSLDDSGDLIIDFLQAFSLKESIGQIGWIHDAPWIDL